jgi:hypothetical protein
VVVETEMGEIVAVRAEGPESDLGIVWQMAPSTLPFPDSRPLTDEWPHMFVAAGGFLFITQPFGERLDVFDRCGHWRWSLDNMRLDYGRGAVLGAELILLGESIQDFWSHCADDPLGIVSSKLWAIHVDGRMEQVGMGIPGYPVSAFPLGEDRFLAWSMDGRMDGDHWDPAREYCSLLERGGTSAQTFAIETPPLPQLNLGGTAFSRADRLVTTTQHDRFGWWQSVLQEYAMDGTLRWERDDLFPAASFAGFLLGRDGRVVVLGMGYEGSPPHDATGTVVFVLGEDGAIQHRETFREAQVMLGARPLLAMDGTLYFMGRTADQVMLIAVQTPVPGPQPGDMGWLRPVGRTPAADWWAP